MLTLFTKLILTFFNYCYLGEFPCSQVKLKLNKGILFLSAPAIIIGCSKSVFPPAESVSHNHSCTKSVSLSELGYGSTLDILAFNDDRLQRLDSYQRIEDFDGTAAFTESTGGKKIFFLYSGTQKDRYSWAEICSFSSLRRITCDLEKESRGRASMAGLCKCEAGRLAAELEMIPLTCQVAVQSLECNFSGKPYAGQTIRNVKVYLINANAVSSIVPNSAERPTRLINAGMLNESDVKAFYDRSIIVQELKEEVSATALHPDISLLCYPNSEDRSRSTRLVIEGEVEGNRYYWPIEVNDGLRPERGHRYTYRITIRGKGVCDPESILEPTVADIQFDIEQWQEKEEYQVGF